MSAIGFTLQDAFLCEWETQYNIVKCASLHYVESYILCDTPHVIVVRKVRPNIATISIKSCLIAGKIASHPVNPLQ